MFLLLVYTKNCLQTNYVDVVFPYHNKEQWEDACSCNSLMERLIQTIFDTAVEWQKSHNTILIMVNNVVMYQDKNR